ncbi:MAG TPA: DMT family transporter [Burkholderiales bacterium]|nr:DMT family transporter [Burkholderiales bacterium]
MHRKPLDSVAFATMLLCCFIWGFTQVAIKLAAADISPVMQSGLRSVLATALLYGWTRWRGIPLFDRDGTLKAGLIAGLLFAGEFLFIYAGLAHTAASRMVVFIYTAPCLTALGLHWFVPGESLVPAQWLGILLAFGGILTAFGDGFASSPASLLGDVFGVIGGALWAATTVWIRATGLTRASPAKVLFYQLAMSAITMPIASWLMGEHGVNAFTPIAIASLVYQGAIVAFATYLTWFWLLSRYLGGRLAVFGFLTPLFGVIMGAAVLDEPLRPAFLGALAMVGTGIWLVNARR